MEHEKQLQSLHQDSEELTPELLRKFPGCEHYTDEQAKEIVLTIHQLAELLYNLALPQQFPKVDNEGDNIKDIVLSNDIDVSQLNQAA